MTAPPATSLRLVVPSPGSWLTGFDPEAANARWALEALWRVQARTSLLAAESDEWHRLAPSWKARVLVRPVEVARTGLLGIHQAEDVRPSWHAVRDVLSASGVQVARDVMSLGAVDQHGGQLVVELRPLVVRGE